MPDAFIKDASGVAIGAANPLPVLISGPGASGAGSTAPAVADITVTNVATVIKAAGARQSITIKNIDTAISVYLGPAGVTSGTGLELKPGESYTVASSAAWYGITASGSAHVRYVEVA